MNILYIVIPAAVITAIIIIIFFYRKNNSFQKKSLLEEAGRFPPLSPESKTWLAFNKKGKENKNQEGKTLNSGKDSKKNKEEVAAQGQAYQNIEEMKKKGEKLDKVKVKNPKFIVEEKLAEEKIKEAQKQAEQAKKELKKQGKKSAKENKKESKVKSKSSSGPQTSQEEGEQGFSPTEKMKKLGLIKEVEGPPVNLKKGKEIYNLFTTLIESKEDEKLIELIMKTQDEEIRALMKVKETISVDSKTKADSILRKVNSKKDLIDMIKEEIINNLKSKHDILKGKISELRKKGKPVKHESLISIRIPPKIKMFNATFGKKDLEDVHAEIKNLEDSINIKIGQDLNNNKASEKNPPKENQDKENDSSQKENKEGPTQKINQDENPQDKKIKTLGEEKPKKKAKPKAKIGRQKPKSRKTAQRKPSARTSSKAKVKKSKSVRKKRH